MPASLQEQIERFEALLEEMRTATTEAHIAIKAQRDERKAFERLLAGDDVKKIVKTMVEKVVQRELDNIGPEIRALSTGVYKKVQQQADELVNIALGDEFAKQTGAQSLRPLIAAKLKAWIREVLEENDAVLVIRAKEESGGG